MLSYCALMSASAQTSRRSPGQICYHAAAFISLTVDSRFCRIGTAFPTMRCVCSSSLLRPVGPPATLTHPSRPPRSESHRFLHKMKSFWKFLLCLPFVLGLLYYTNPSIKLVQRCLLPDAFHRFCSLIRGRLPLLRGQRNRRSTPLLCLHSIRKTTCLLSGIRAFIIQAPPTRRHPGLCLAEQVRSILPPPPTPPPPPWPNT